VPSLREAHRISQVEARRARLERVRALEPDSFGAYYEMLVAKFITLAALLPFAAGSALAWAVAGEFDFPVFVVAEIALFLIMGAVNTANTYYDYEADLQNDEFSVYSGGIRVLVENRVTDRRKALWLAVALLVAGGLVGLTLPFVFHTGPWTLPLGVFGSLCGWFYTARPLSLVYRGLGEAVIAVCSGILTVVSGYYLQTGAFDPVLVPVAGTLALSILNVIIINEFADVGPDERAGKRTLVVRLGKERCSRVYAANAVLAMCLIAAAPLLGCPWYAAAAGLISCVHLAVANVRRMLAGDYGDDGINDVTWDTFRLHFNLEASIALALSVGGAVVHVVARFP